MCEEDDLNNLQQIADQVRLNLVAVYGEACFAKLCMVFDQHVMPDPWLEKYEMLSLPFKPAGLELASKQLSVLRILAHQSNEIVAQLSLVWLAGHGWELMNVNVLGALILGVRNLY